MEEVINQDLKDLGLVFCSSMIGSSMIWERKRERIAMWQSFSDYSYTNFCKKGLIEVSLYSRREVVKIMSVASHPSRSMRMLAAVACIAMASLLWANGKNVTVRGCLVPGI